jgi:tight adherence protein C
LLVVLAALNRRWVPARVTRFLDAFIAKAGSPFELEAAELLAAIELGVVALGAPGIALGIPVGFGPSLPAILAVAGGSAPVLWLHDRLRTRRHQIVRALPHALDLLTLSVEAGLDFTAALAKAVEKGRRGALRDELSISIAELRLGKTREEALRSLAARIGLPALTSFVQALLHADRMGTPLGRVLRVLSTQMRVDRTHRAEKLANEAPVKLLLPLVLFIFPTLFLMLFGPIGYQVFAGESF